MLNVKLNCYLKEENNVMIENIYLCVHFSRLNQKQFSSALGMQVNHVTKSY